MDLSPRLAAIADLIPHGTRVADIGTDHAMLSLNLVNSGRSPKVIATDLNEHPYQTACRQVLSSDIQNKVEVRKGDGLEVIGLGEVDVVVIAGMGGNTIIGILERSREVISKVTRLVLQPMADAPSLRFWLVQNGWHLVDEELVKEDHKIYVIIVAEPGDESVEDSFVMEIGPILLRKCSPIRNEYLERIKDDYQRVLSGLARSRSQEAMDKAIEITIKLAKLREVIKNAGKESRYF